MQVYPHKMKILLELNPITMGGGHPPSIRAKSEGNPPSILDKSSPIGIGFKYDDINTILSVVIKIVSYVGNPVHFVRRESSLQAVRIEY